MIIITICYDGLTTTEEAAPMEKEYFIDTLFDLINESDALEAELQDVRVDRNGLTVSMKGRTVLFCL